MRRQASSSATAAQRGPSTDPWHRGAISSRGFRQPRVLGKAATLSPDLSWSWIGGSSGCGRGSDVRRLRASLSRSARTLESSSMASSGLDYEDTALTLTLCLPGSDPASMPPPPPAPAGRSRWASEALFTPKAQVVGCPPLSRNWRNALPSLRLNDANTRKSRMLMLTRGRA